jgi:CheY-like chemotaxis protein
MPQWGTETVLVVDDELAVLSLTQMLLTRYGYSVLTASSGQEALHLFEVWPDQHVHFAVIDIVMPVMDGFEVAAALRSIRPDLPILFTSAYSDRPELRPEKARNIPYLAKPFSSVKLIAKMRQMLDNPGSKLVQAQSLQANRVPLFPTEPDNRTIDTEALRAALCIFRSYIDRTSPDETVVACLRTKIGSQAEGLNAQELACAIVERYLQESKAKAQIRTGSADQNPGYRGHKLIQ